MTPVVRDDTLVYQQGEQEQTLVVGTMESVLTSLLNAITALPTDVVVVLDNYHVITAQSIHDALTFQYNCTWSSPAALIHHSPWRDCVREDTSPKCVLPSCASP